MSAASGKHTGLGNQKKPKGWESPPPLPAPDSPDFAAWASQPQRDTSGVNSGMVGHTSKPREASEPDTNPHRINLDTTGAEVDSDVAAMHAAHADIANDEQFGDHKPAPAKTKLGGGEIDTGGIADFQAKLLADRASRGVPANGDYTQKKSEWEKAGGASGSGTAEEAHAMLTAHRNEADAKPARAVRAAKTNVTQKKAPRASAEIPTAIATEQVKTPAPAKPAIAEAPKVAPEQPAKTPDVSPPSPAASESRPATPATGKLTRVGNPFAGRSTPTSFAVPQNESGTKVKVYKEKTSAPEAAAAPAEAPKSRYVEPEKPSAPAPASAPVQAPAPSRPAARPAPPAPVVPVSPVRTAPQTGAASSKVIGGGNVPTLSPAQMKETVQDTPPATQARQVVSTPAAPAPDKTARAPRSSKSIGDGWSDGGVHHHVHNYYGGQHFGDVYHNAGGVQNIGGSVSIGQSGGSVGGGNSRPGGTTGGGSSRSPGGTSGGHGRAYGKASPTQFALHTLMNSTVNGKSLNDHVFHATGEHFEQHDSSGSRIGDVHSDAHKARNVRGHEAAHHAADAYHADYAQTRQQRQSSRTPAAPTLGQQFTP